ncbi:MAG TPA: PfkB family carbohydrate kinase, partial [Candidatus Limnocylindrales bacterium]|nr:PfkB family carbohydrate kinase [Candidatus Limnocylindrales bacterium]
MNKFKVVTFGEIMLRLSTPGFQRLIQAHSLDVTYGGGEANVAVSLANFGFKSSFVTKIPDNPVGQAAINHLRRFGVNTAFIVRGGERLGIYFLETGVSQRPSVVTYDRA